MNPNLLPEKTALLLKTAFDGYYPISLDIWKSMVSHGEIVEVNRDEILKKAYDTEKYLYYILSGSGGIVIWHRDNFVCTDLVLENDFLCDYLSFLTVEPTPYEVMTFTRCSLFRISRMQFDLFTGSVPEGDKIWRYATQALYVEKHYQQMQSITLSAAERYRMMLEHQPHIIREVPQKYIVSYLGITPQSLSRIRNENVRS